MEPSDKLCIFVCDLFLQETKAVIDSGRVENLEVMTFPAKCGQPPINKEDLASLINKVGADNNCHILGSCCLSLLKDKPGDINNCHLHHFNQCFYMFANSSLIDGYLKQGAYLVTPGWLAKWKKMIALWGFDKETAQKFFNESTKKLVLLDTGVDKKSLQNLKALSDFVNQPFEVISLGLDFFTLYIRNIVLDWKCETTKNKTGSTLALSRKQVADYSMALDLLSKISQTFTETEIIEKMLEIFAMLFASNELFYLPVKDGNLGDICAGSKSHFDADALRNKLSCFDKKYEWTESGKGFILRVAYKNNTVGVVKVDEIVFSEYKSVYLNLATYIVEICGLAVGNARTYQRIKHTEAKLAVQVITMFHSSNNESEIIRNIIGLVKEFANFDAVAIRLKKSDGFSCYNSIGFTSEFINSAKTLGTQNIKDEFVDILNNNHLPERVGEKPIPGKTDFTHSLFTEHGSFYTNDLTKLLSSPKDSNGVYRLIDQCKNEGYKSLALIPLPSESGPIGLLQLNSHRPDMFSDDLIAFYEVIATSIATVIKRRQSVDVIKDSEAKYIDLYDNAPDMYVSVSAETAVILQCNQTLANKLGYTKKEIVGQPIFFVYHPDSIEDVKNAFNLFCKTGEVDNAELQLKRKDGTKIDVILNMTAVRGMNGKIIQSRSVWRDITDRKQVEEALRLSETSLAEAQRLAHLGDWDWDIQEDKVRWSNEIYNLLGLTTNIFGGSFDTFFSFVHPDDKKFVKQSIDNALNNSKLYDINHRIIRSDGSERIVHAKAEVTFNDFDKPVKMKGTILDITESKQVERERLKALKLESVGVLAGGIAHDFNNILTAILGNTNLAMINTNQNDKSYDNLVNIENATLRARDLTQQLLTFSKGGSPVRKTTSINELIKESAIFAIRGSNVQCEFCIPGNLLPLDVDEGQLNQVINNLIINAMQAMPKGGAINIKAENLSENEILNLPSLKQDRYVKISVKDQGMGIPSENLSRVFDPYFSDKEKGNGLGLATSYSIIKNHDGLITVESQLEVGTTFHVYLPASTKSIDKIEDIKEVKEVKEVKGHGKILIMDDEEMIRDTAYQLLNFIGYEAECAENGTVAIDMYKSAKKSGKPFDIVILDLTVPGGMGGEEAIKKLHEMDPDVKAIVSSGYSNNPVMANFEKYGFKGVIPKPFKLDEMNGILQKIIMKTSLDTP